MEIFKKALEYQTSESVFSNFVLHCKNGFKFDKGTLYNVICILPLTCKQGSFVSE